MSSIEEPQVHSQIVESRKSNVRLDKSPAIKEAKAKLIGYYLIGRTLGQGTFGKVKEAIHILTGEKVAIKILIKSKIVEIADVERVQREIHILKNIRHSNII